MYQRKVDIIKQPIPIILGTFALLVGLLTARAVSVSLPCEDLLGALSPVGAWFDGLFAPLWGVVFSVAMMVFSAVVFTRIISRYSISVIHSFLPLVLYVVFVGGVAFAVGSPSVQLALFLLARSAELMVRSFKRCEMFDDVMCASFYAGLAALLIPDVLYVALLVCFQWLLYRRSVRECVAGVVMFLLPIMPAEFVGWCAGSNVGGVMCGWADALSPLGLTSVESLVQSCGGVLGVVVLGVLLLLGVVSAGAMIASSDSMRIRARKMHTYFIMLFLVGVVMLLLGVAPGVSMAVIGLGAVPLVHTYFVRQQGVVSVILYVVLLVVTIARAVVLM